MTERREPFWDWPGWGVLGYALVLGAAQVFWFGLVYGGTDYLTARHTFRVRLHLPGELSLPFVPAMVLGYLSIYPLFWAAPFVLRTRRQIAALNGTLGGVILCGGLGFLLFPGEILFPPPEDTGVWAPLVDFAKRLALRHNLMPSLHVALSAVCVAVYAARAGTIGKVVLWACSLLIGLSTLLLHQHYLIDVVAGYALAGAGVRWGYRRWASPGTS